MRLNNKGFSLVEVLAVVVILGVLVVIMIPAVNDVIKKNRENNLKDLKESIISSAKLYVSDNRYNIKLSESCDNNPNGTVGVASIDGQAVAGLIFLFALNEKGYLSSSKIVNPNDKKELDLQSYVKFEFDCKKREYVYYPFSNTGECNVVSSYKYSCLKWK